jgi:hypothetical protein
MPKLKKFLVPMTAVHANTAIRGTLFFVQNSATGCTETITVNDYYGKENQMIQLPSFTTVPALAINEFTSLRSRAVKASWWAKLLQRNNSPRSFVASSASGLFGKRLAGIQNIQVKNIVGTIHRTEDFDKNFRPLKKHLRERWVNARVQLDTEGWEPIVVHKVGDVYYVKDGHHRVSVARAVGMMFIEAEVWDHTTCQQPPCAYKRSHEVARRHANVVSENS